jgi:hypothetical protein
MASLFMVVYSHSVTVTEAMLRDLVNHSLVLRIWDNKDKVSPRAKFDKPKAFWLAQERPGKS